MSFLRGSEPWAVRRVLGGHPEDFEILVRKYQKKAFAIARSLGVPDSGIDDVVQESFLLSFRDLGALEKPSRFGAWFLQIVRNTARRHLRRLLSAPPEAPHGSEETVQHHSPEEEDFRNYLWKKVAALPEVLREAICLYYYEGESVREVAVALGISASAVKKRLERGRDALREDLWQELAKAMKDTLPSEREWKRKRRHLTALALAALPLSLRARARAGGLPGPDNSGSTLSAGAGAFGGKSALLALIATLLGLGATLLWSGGGRAEPQRDQAIAGRLPAPPKAQPSPRAEDPPRPPAPRPAAPEDAPLVLRIEDDRGSAVDDARVSLFWKSILPGGEFEIGRSAEQPSPLGPGEFGISKRQGTSAIFRIGAPGFLSTMDERELPPPGDSTPFVVVLKRGPAFSGQLVDPLTDRPVPRGRVGLLAPNPGSSAPVTRQTAALPPPDFDPSAPIELYQEVEADAEGRFSITGIPGTIWATAAGYAPSAVLVPANWFPDPGQSALIPLFPATTLEISVRRKNGERVKSFSYSLARDLNALPGPPFAKTVRGSAKLQSVYHLFRWDGGRIAPVEEIALGVGCGELVFRKTLGLKHGRENRIAVALDRPGATFHGRALDPAGVPVSGARIILAGGGSRVSLGNPQRSPAVGTVMTDGEGRYQVSLAGAGPPFRILAEHPGHPAFIGDPREAAPGEPTREDVRFSAAASIVLQAAAAPGSGLKGSAELRSPVIGLEPVVDCLRRAEFDASGRAEFENVPPGVWELKWPGPGGRNLRRLLSISPGGHYQVGAGDDPPGGMDVSGLVVDRGAPVAGSSLLLHSANSLLGRAVTDGLGRFTFPGIPPGSHDLVVLPSPDRPSAQFPLLVEGGAEPAVIDLTSTTFLGRVVAGGRPVPRAEVEVHQRTFLHGAACWRPVRTVSADLEGRFRIPRLHRVPCVLLVRKEGFRSRLLEIEPRGEAELRIPDLVLDSPEGSGGTRFEVRTSGEAAPAGPFSLEVYSAAGGRELLMARLSSSDPDEPLEIRGLPAGRYRVLVSAGKSGIPAHSRETVEFEAPPGGNTVVPVLLRPAGTVILELASEDGTLPGPAVAEVEDRTGRPVVFAGNLARLAFQGCVVLEGVPAPEVKVRLTVPGLDPFEVTLGVEPGRAVRVVHRLPAASQRIGPANRTER